MRVNIGIPVVRTDGRSVGRSRDYQIFWDGKIYLPMVLRRRASRARAPLLVDFETENPVLENCLIFETSNSLEAQQPVPETNKSCQLEDSQLIARARAVGVIYEFAEPGLVETQDDRRKRHR